MPKGSKPSKGQPKGQPKETPKGSSKGPSRGQSKGPSKGPPRTAFQLLQQQLKWVDLIFEVLDARAPLSSRHPKNDEIFGNKPRLIFLTKDDLADPKVSRECAKKLSSEHVKVIVLSLKDRRRQPEVVNMALELSEEKIKQIEAKGLLPRPVRICVVGMPNTGKSSLINWLIGKKQVKVADRPGVTRGPQWIRVHPKLELLDTPGILPPNISSRNVGEKLGIFNLAPAGAYAPEELAERAIAELQKRYPGALEKYIPEAEGDLTPAGLDLQNPPSTDEDDEEDGQNWKLERDLNISKQSKRNRRSGEDNALDYEDDDLSEVSQPDSATVINEKINLQLIAERKRFLTTKGRPDTSRAAAVFLGDIRNGRLGRITFDSPDGK
ncbi:MAG: ribosome biogenesis GTPase YlqF [Candidatus Melainabacteria bacterium]|nr:MAG: ribosome biogenesis GTPase YlqF [Candidatus Melainabacteria bacterium]